MPIKPKKPCAYPDCPNLTHDTYCEEHQALSHKQYDKFSRAPNHDKKYGNNWRRIRALYVKQHPLCERCLKEGRITPVKGSITSYLFLVAERTSSRTWCRFARAAIQKHTMSSAIGNRGRGIRISTTEKLKTEPGVSCAKIRVQTVFSLHKGNFALSAKL